MSHKKARKVRPPVTLHGWQQRLATAFDELLEKSITPQHAHGLADLAEKSVLFTRLECQLLEVALNNERELKSDFLPAVDEVAREPTAPRLKQVYGGRP